MAKKRKKSYKRDTVAEEKASSKLGELHTKYDDDDLIEEILLETLDHKSVQADGIPPVSDADIAVILGEEAPHGEAASDASAEDEPSETSAVIPAEMHDSVPAPEETEDAHADEAGDPQPDDGTSDGCVPAEASEEEPEPVPPAEELPAEPAPRPEKKKKKSDKKKSGQTPLKPIFSIANIVYTAAVFAVITVAFLALPRSDISETEQRKLAAFPTFSISKFINGGYTEGITDYFNDNVPYRDDIKRAAAGIRNLYGVSYNDARIIGPVAVISEEEEEEPVPISAKPEQTSVPVTAPASTTASTTAKSSATAGTTTTPEAAETSAETTATAATTTRPPANTSKNVNEIAEGVVTNGQVVTKLSDGHWWGLSLFGGGKGTVYANALNRFKKELGDSVNVYSMPAPTAGEYYLPDTYAKYNASHRKSVDQINAQLEGVIPVPALDALWEHTGENIYLRTDHHWQPLGAYYAAKCFAETAGVPFADISTMERVDIPGYVGTMYGFTESAELLADPEVFTYYKPTNSYKVDYYDTSYNYTLTFSFFIPMPVNASYSTFMGADNKIVHISTDAGTGRKLVIFKDSYGNAEIPFYFSSFDDIYVCDMRYFDLNGVQFVKHVGATDLLFTECTFSAVGTNANGLEKILNNPVTEMN